MKKKGIKRALAFLLAVVFAFSTCMTAGPYTVQATDVGRILRTFKIKKNVEVTDNGKIII